MIIVLSPAKTLDYESPLDGFDYTTPSFLGKSESLIKIMRSYEPEYTSDLMGLSDNLAFLNFERYQTWKKQSKPSKDSRQAIFAFKGDVYHGLEANNLSKSITAYVLLLFRLNTNIGVCFPPFSSAWFKASHMDSFS